MAKSHCDLLGNYFTTYCRCFFFFMKRIKKNGKVRKEFTSVKQIGRFTNKTW